MLEKVVIKRLLEEMGGLEAKVFFVHGALVVTGSQEVVDKVKILFDRIIKEELNDAQDTM